MPHALSSLLSPRNALVTGGLLLVLSLAGLGFANGARLPALLPSVNPNGISVDCATSTLTVAVFNWPAGSKVEVQKQPSGPTTDTAPLNGVATFSLSAIGGNGNYTAGRQDHPTDPVPVAFTVDCSLPSPSPTPTASPVATPRASSPAPMPKTGAYWGG